VADMDAVNTLLKQVLDGTTARNRALANNIANATTAGYRRRDVEFLSELKSAMKGEHGKDVASWKPEMKTSRREIPIRLEKEFALLAENQLLYQTTAEVLSRRYSGLRAAILGRR
jgi:flagellar basal-body rod protein FlgB